MKGGRKYDAMPEVSIGTFAPTWTEWWVRLQPEWRGETFPLSTEAPEVSDWSELRKGGPNGIFVVLLSLGWWGMAMESDEELTSWGDVFMGFRWVLEQLLGDTNADTDIEGAPVRKKYVFDLFIS